AGKPPPGLHLDVTKDDKMVQKLMIDEKKCYFFGRNKDMCDFCIDHQSCSRIHAALVWHKHLNRPFIVDLGSTHGTFVGTIRLESRKPQQVPLDSKLHFGASTRKYIIRERPQNVPQPNNDDSMTEDMDVSLLGLPETETELENLTEFNTAHNRRVVSISDIRDENTSTVNPLKRKKRAFAHVSFNEDEQVINPEDIDPSVGRFRNMVSTTVIPNKRSRTDAGGGGGGMNDSISTKLHNFPYAQNRDLYSDMATPTSPTSTFSFSSKLGLPMPNLAPDLDIMPEAVVNINPTPVMMNIEEPNGPKKKKYAKEAWPGKKPHHLLV
ncbi:unnamed protein product, partial [Owenia fusiformis]